MSGELIGTSDALVASLREADEDDVEAALADSYVADALQGIAPDVLLEFFRRMLDRLIGPEDD